MGRPRRVLLVCMGNICRSPTAEEVLRVKARQSGLRIEFDSAGTENYHVGDPPDPRSVRHARERGYDLSALRARQVHAADFQAFDLILAADELNLRELRRRCPAEERHRLALFLGDVALPDPYYGESDDFEKVLDLVEKQAAALVSAWTQATE
ncbi:MAG: low molecular weight phosphotyrosine protein phosphatase [Verrucomicrobia bacterium]|nr:low molecular weight phosphotyrosine protein phosphatase [Verrucomicrobiota bacterium]